MLFPSGYLWVGEFKVTAIWVSLSLQWVHVTSLMKIFCRHFSVTITDTRNGNIVVLSISLTKHHWRVTFHPVR